MVKNYTFVFVFLSVFLFNSFEVCGLVPPNETEAFKMYPNPAQGVLTLELSSNDVSAEFSILSLNGAVVKEFQVEENKLIKQIDITDIRPGIYTLSDGAYSKKLIVK